MQFALERRLPTITDIRWTGSEFQPLMSYGAVPHLLIPQAADYVERILWRGAKPGDLPIQLPSKFELVVNLKTAKAIGITVPQSILCKRVVNTS